MSRSVRMIHSAPIPSVVPKPMPRCSQVFISLSFYSFLELHLFFFLVFPALPSLTPGTQFSGSTFHQPLSLQDYCSLYSHSYVPPPPYPALLCLVVAGDTGNSTSVFPRRFLCILSNGMLCTQAWLGWVCMYGWACLCTCAS